MMNRIDLAPPYRLVNARHGLFLVNLQDHYIGKSLDLYGEYGEIEHAFMQNFIQTGRDIVEVGANMGSHTVALARQAAQSGRRLMAIEPQPVVFQNMCANVALNRLFNVQTENCACAEVPSWLTFDAMDYSAVGNFGGVHMRLDGQGSQRVRSVPLDDLVDASWDVGFIKIDVEGFERSVLQGATALIARSKPVIYVENDRVDQSPALIECLWSLGYDLWFHCPQLFNPDNFAGVTDNYLGNVASFNMICLPKRGAGDLPYPIIEAPVQDAGFHPLKRQ